MDAEHRRNVRGRHEPFPFALDVAAFVLTAPIHRAWGRGRRAQIGRDGEPGEDAFRHPLGDEIRERGEVFGVKPERAAHR